MPVVPAITGIATGDPISISDLYKAPGTGGIYQPGDTTTLEILHGGLDEDNLGTDPLPPQTVQAGAFVVAGTVALQRPEVLYARQMSDAGTAVPLAQGGTTIVLPWDASLVILQWQAFVLQDATWWDYGGPDESEEGWRITAAFTGTSIGGGMGARLPAGRGTIDAATLSPLVNDPGLTSEGRNRFVQGSYMLFNVAKGRYRFHLSAENSVEAPDQLLAALTHASGSVTYIAFR